MIPRGLKFITVSQCLEERRSKTELLENFSIPPFQSLHIRFLKCKFLVEGYSGEIQSCSFTVGFVSVTPEWIHFTQKIRDWLQVSASVIQSKDYSGNAIVQASVSLTIAAGYFDQPFSFKMPQKITKLKMIIFSIHLLSKWTSDEGRDPPFCPGCSMFTDCHCPARWLSRLLSPGCLLPASAEEDGWGGRPKYWISRGAVWSESILSAGK